MAGRLPDFLIIGAMTSGITTLRQWLTEQPEVHMPAKQTHFFSRPLIWGKGVDWYSGNFREASPEKLVGEASPSYMNPRSALTAARIAKLMPDAKLIAILRNPVERLRSHYRHEVQRGREKRPLEWATAVPSNYVNLSLYHERLKPYFDFFVESQICVLKFEDLFFDDGETWRRVLQHLGLEPRPRPADAPTIGVEKDSSADPLSEAVLAGIRQDTDRLPALLGPDAPRWRIAELDRLDPGDEKATDLAVAIAPRSTALERDAVELFLPRLPESTHGPPQRSYLICALPRTGSTFLCDLLTSTGVAGYPTEYFAPQLTESIRDRIRADVPDYREFIRRVLEAATTPNGLFGAKLQAGYTEEFLSQAGYTIRDRYEALKEIFPGLKLVALSRRDRAAQAVSLFRANESSQWVSELKLRRRPVYDFEGILRCYDEIEAGEYLWKTILKDAEQEPLRLEYEALADDPIETVHRVLGYLEVDSRPEIDLSKVRLRKQADELTMEWQARFLQEVDALRVPG